MQRPDRAKRLQPGDYFGASEATIFSKRGSPRSESQWGWIVNARSCLWHGRGFRWRRPEHFFKARVATKWIPLRVQTQLVIPVLSLCSRNLLDGAQCSVALAGMGEKHRHRKFVRLLFRARDFRQRGILPAHRRVGESHVEMGIL